MANELYNAMQKADKERRSSSYCIGLFLLTSFVILYLAYPSLKSESNNQSKGLERKTLTGTNSLSQTAISSNYFNTSLTNSPVYNKNEQGAIKWT